MYVQATSEPGTCFAVTGQSVSRLFQSRSAGGSSGGGLALAEAGASGPTAAGEESVVAESVPIGVSGGADPTADGFDVTITLNTLITLVATMIAARGRRG